jgi:hypothetical protein
MINSIDCRQRHITTLMHQTTRRLSVGSLRLFAAGDWERYFVLQLRYFGKVICRYCHLPDNYCAKAAYLGIQLLTTSAMAIAYYKSKSLSISILWLMTMPHSAIATCRECDCLPPQAGLTVGNPALLYSHNTDPKHIDTLTLMRTG